MKKLISLLTLAVILVSLAACEAESYIITETTSQQETTFQTETITSNADPVFTETQIDIQTTPLVIKNQTFTEANPAYETGIAGETGGGIYYIKNDGNLYYQHFKSWDFTEPDGGEILAEVDVRSVYGCEINSYAQFFIKSDNSLWSFGDNSDGRFGGRELGAIHSESGYITRENAVKLMDDVAEIYEFSDEVYIIKTDKTLLRFKNAYKDGVTDYTTSIEIAKNVVKVYADGQYLTEFDTVPADDEPWQNGGSDTTFAYIIPEKSGQNEGKPKYGITSDGTVAFVDSGIIVATEVKLP